MFLASMCCYERFGEDIHGNKEEDNTVLQCSGIGSRNLLNNWNSGTCDRGKARRGPKAMPTALRLTNKALALVRSLRATYIAMYRRLTARAEPEADSRQHLEHGHA